ncbi:hypothetical protein, partial [Corallococcus sp. 4LFB]|uniref:hypothetical protein n=1 Tax=Corallococcus sp. 4LFB TaxID=3383249 RepID=UPI00397512BF
MRGGGVLVRWTQEPAGDDGVLGARSTQQAGSGQELVLLGRKQQAARDDDVALRSTALALRVVGLCPPGQGPLRRRVGVIRGRRR